LKPFVITIARGFGSGGQSIAKILSENLSVPVYYNQIAKMASEYSGLSENLFNRSEEKFKGSSLLKRLKLTPDLETVFTPSENKFVSEDNLFNIQAKIIRELAKTESCIIIGKCANFLLADCKNVVSIYIEAPREFCVKSVINNLGVTPEEAHSLIKKTDKYRAEYYKYYTGGHKWTDPVAYDMTLNTGRISFKESSEIIMNFLKIKNLTK
jgi:cytidylate kinase